MGIDRRHSRSKANADMIYLKLESEVIDSIGCHNIGIWGGCGDGCSVRKEGQCPVQEETLEGVLLQDDADIRIKRVDLMYFEYRKKPITERITAIDQTFLYMCTIAYGRSSAFADSVEIEWMLNKMMEDRVETVECLHQAKILQQRINLTL